MVVVVLPDRRDRPGIAKPVEDLQGQALVTESPVEALGVAVLPRAAGLDVERRDTDTTEPGPEFVAKEIQGLLGRACVRTLYIQKASPWENGYVESFNGRLRDKLLDRELFLSLIDARVVRDHWETTTTTGGRTAA